MGSLVYAAAAIALRCNLSAAEPTPPMYVTLNDGSSTVQVTMAGQTYIEDTVSDGAILWWQVKGRDGIIIRSRLNRVDGSIIVTNEHPSDDTKRALLKGMCQVARNKF